MTRLRITGENPQELAKKQALLDTVEGMSEINPMMGLRSVRAAIIKKGITEMQARAIFEAGCRQAKKGIKVHAEIMIPLVSHINELKLQYDVIQAVAQEVMAAEGVEIDYKLGTMIETPRAALTANESPRIRRVL